MRSSGPARIFGACIAAGGRLCGGSTTAGGAVLLMAIPGAGACAAAAMIMTAIGLVTPASYFRSGFLQAPGCVQSFGGPLAYFCGATGVFCEAIATHRPLRFWKMSVQL